MTRITDNEWAAGVMYPGAQVMPIALGRVLVFLPEADRRDLASKAKPEGK